MTPRSCLVRNHDRTVVLKLDLVCGPGTPRRTAAQRRNRQHNGVAWSDCLAGPTVANQCARALAFEAPSREATVRPFDLENDKRVWTGELEFQHFAGKFDRVL